MKINWLTYNLSDAVINYRQWHIKLDSYDEAWNIVNTYPITYSKEEFIKEIKEVIIKDEVGEKYLVPWENDWDPAVTATRYKPDEVVQQPTGQMIPNPQYFDAKSLVDIENWLIANHWFTK
jgi:hypothetical protein